MKELTIEEKAKAYDKAIDKAKKELDACGSQDCDAARQIFRLFSELNVSEDEDEDEKIRKMLIKFFGNGAFFDSSTNGIPDKDIVAWLEKQGQTFTKKDVDDAWLKGMCDAKKELEKQSGQNPTWSREDDNKVKEIIEYLDAFFYNYSNDYKTWFNSLKERVQPKQEWSVEDKSKVQRICKYLDEAKKYYADIIEVRECMDWLKSLEDRYTWKPSEKQIMCLQDALSDYHRRGYKAGTLETLLKQLKQL